MIHNDIKPENIVVRRKPVGSQDKHLQLNCKGELTYEPASYLMCHFIDNGHAIRNVPQPPEGMSSLERSGPHVALCLKVHKDSTGNDSLRGALSTNRQRDVRLVEGRTFL